MDSGMNKLPEKLDTLNRRVGLVLRAGTILSLLLMAAGMVLFLITGTAGMTALTPLTSLFPDLLLLSPTALVTLGLYLILLMPAVILFTSLYHFIVKHEKLPVILCLLLIIMLAISYILALK
ncbi:MAG: DUF1634 domain-containing protein [Dehalococcoidia bacterium]|nr:DUF1634 domain-containing protein [Dehalococcoidia bacterium]